MEKIVEKRKGNGLTKENHKLYNEKNGEDLVTTVNILEGGDIGIKFATSRDNFALVVRDFLRDSSGQLLPAEKTRKIWRNDLLSHINGSLVLGEKGEGKMKALSLLEEVGGRRPLSLGFVKPYLYSIVIEKSSDEDGLFGGPSELLFTEVKSGSNSKESKIVLKDFALAEGAAESGGVFIGDNLVFINGIPVGAGCRLTDSTPPQLGKYCASPCHDASASTRNIFILFYRFSVSVFFAPS